MLNASKWAWFPCMALGAVASAATFDSPVLPIAFDDGIGTTGTAWAELIDPNDAALDGLWGHLDWEFDLSSVGTVPGTITVNSFNTVDYGIDAATQTRVLGLGWAFTPQGDIADYQIIFLQGLQTSLWNTVLNSLNDTDPGYPFDASALSGNYAWVLEGPELMEDRRYLIFSRPVLDFDSNPVLGPNSLPMIEVADVLVMSLDATLVQVPEPSLLGLLAFAPAVLLQRRRRSASPAVASR
jgi:hypothetical protein